MPDIQYRQTLDFPRYEVLLDWLLTTDNVLDDKLALQSAVIVALGTDATADKTDVLPNIDDDDRRGWWGDLDAEEIWGGWPVGCKLWLLRRAKITGPGAVEGSTTARAENYVAEAMVPFIKNKIISTFSAQAARLGRERIDVDLKIYRGPDREIDLRYSDLWEEVS